MPSKQSKKVYRIITLLTLLAFIFMNAGYASIGSGALRPPMNFAKEADVSGEDERLTSRDTNPILNLLGRKGARGNITIDDKTTVISMGGGDGYGLNDLIADIAEKTHAEDGRVIVVLHGLKGLLSDKWQDNLFEITPEIAKRLRGLPSIASGSCREKVDPKKSEGLEKIEKIIKRTQNAKKVVFIGGNDHLRLTKIIADKIKELKSQGQDIKTKIIGVSKSIDNDFGNTMLCHCTAFMAGRKIVKRASVLDNGNKIMVFESFGRYMGGLNLEMSKACPYSKAVLSPERKVTIQNIVDAWVQGVRNFFVSEGFSLSEDLKLDELLAAFPVLRAMWDKAHKSLDRDAWGNPKLTGASLYVVGILEHFCHAKEVGRTDLTYQLRGAFSEKDSDGRDFEKFLAKGFSKVAILDLEENGLAVVYDGNYGEYDPGKFGTRPAEEVYKTKNLDDLMSEQEMARLGVLGTTGVVFKADPVSVPEKDVTLERAMMEAFFANAVSTAAHTYASVMEFRQSSEAIVDSCGKKKASEIAGLPYDLGTVIEGTQDSVLVLIPDRQVSFYEIAQRIKEVVDTAGYVNIAVSKDFALYTEEKDKLLVKVLQIDPILKIKYEKEGNINLVTGLVTFDSGIRYFIAGLFKYLQLKEKEEKGSGIKVEGTKMADMGYAFEGLKSEGYPEGLLYDDNLLAERGVIGANTGNLLQRRAVESSV